MSAGLVPLVAVVLGIALVEAATWAGPAPTTRETIAQAAITGLLAGAAAAGINVGIDTTAAAL